MIGIIYFWNVPLSQSVFTVLTTGSSPGSLSGPWPSQPSDIVLQVSLKFCFSVLLLRYTTSLLQAPASCPKRLHVQCVNVLVLWKVCFALEGICCWKSTWFSWRMHVDSTFCQEPTGKDWVSKLLKFFLSSHLFLIVCTFIDKTLYILIVFLKNVGGRNKNCIFIWLFHLFSNQYPVLQWYLLQYI